MILFLQKTIKSTAVKVFHEAPKGASFFGTWQVAGFQKPETSNARFVASSPRCFVASLPRYLVASLPFPA